MSAALVLGLVVFGAACWDKTDGLLGVTDVPPELAKIIRRTSFCFDASKTL
jgi:hypothetical protein